MPKTILIVEDEPISRKAIATFLREEGYAVEEAKDGAEALDLLDTFHFDLVVSDLRMPHVDGMAVVGHLRSISPKIPFIILTAYPYDAGGVSKMPRALLLKKPIGLKDLESKIRLLLGVDEFSG
jgi:CheY-like chemotaxis protein